MKILLICLFCQFLSAEKHTLKYYFTGSSGLSNYVSELTVMIDDVSLVFCNGTNRSIHPNYAWVITLLHDDPELSEWFHLNCFNRQISFIRSMTSKFKTDFEKGLHFTQIIYFCDLEKGKVTAGWRFGYNGEDFIAMDFANLTWIALQPKAIQAKEWLDTDRGRLIETKFFHTQLCARSLRTSLDIGKSTLLRTDHPSLSLLQKDPSSPVSCHATGFFPNRALMFWRKDGEEIHEGVNHGEILPNNNGSFQMRVYLNISSVSLSDWGRYVCVFQLVGKDEEIIKLDKEVIKSNKERPHNKTTPIIAAVIALVLVSIAAAAGYVAYKKKTGGNLLQSTSSPDTDSEFTERLNPVT